MTVILYMTGNQIATFSSVSSGGNGDGMKVSLADVKTLGTADDVFRIQFTQVSPSATHFSNGQFVSIYDANDKLIYSQLNPQHDMYQGRASSLTHQIFHSPTNLVFDINGISGNTLTYGPGPEPARSTQLPFNALPNTPPAPPEPEHPICFTAGTRILVSNGWRKVETLAPGDMVWTLDNGMQPLRWIGRRTSVGQGPFAPVRIAKGTFGNQRALRVSQQHRILVRNPHYLKRFGAEEALVAAKHLVNGQSVRIAPEDSVDYLHIAFDRHEIILADGMLTESLLLGPAGLKSLDAEARAELMALFPEAVARCLNDGIAAEPARRCLTRREAAL